MHGDMSPHLHTDECNEIVNKLLNCRAEHPIAKLWGYCNDIDFLMTKCFRKEREAHRARNRQLAEERLARIVEKNTLAREERKRRNALGQD